MKISVSFLHVINLFPPSTIYKCVNIPVLYVTMADSDNILIYSATPCSEMNISLARLSLLGCDLQLSNFKLIRFQTIKLFLSTPQKLQM